MKLRAWIKKRGIRFILERARKLNERYGIRPNKAIRRIEQCVDSLRDLGCFPTFFVPGMVVERNHDFIQRLQDLGAEIGVHGYNHVDLKVYSPEDGRCQLLRAAEAFRAYDLAVHGFRCPYLSATDALIKLAPTDVFGYSSNKAIQWPLGNSAEKAESLLFETVEGFYAPVSSEANLCLPWFEDGLVEIPVCVPDDLQLHDGLGYGLEEISQAWLEILHHTHQRGEVFNLMFHPELASFCEAPFLKVLQEAQAFRPKIWLARLREISDWWKEKSTFKAKLECIDDISTLKFYCTSRATILYRGIDQPGPSCYWDGRYWRLNDISMPLNSPVIPLIGISKDAPQWAVLALRGMGFLLEEGENARFCSLFLDHTSFRKYSNAVNLVAFIENSLAPLVRYWPWPDGYRSALSITGDLDALSLIDYANRLWQK